MRFHAKLFALLFSVLCLLAPSISHAKLDSGKLAATDWTKLGTSGTITKDNPLIQTLWAGYGVIATTDINGRPSNVAGYTQAEKENLVAQLMVANEQQYNAYMNQLSGYVQLLEQIQANPGGVDYDAIAKQLGLATGTYTAADIINRLSQIKTIYDEMLAAQQAAASNGVSTGEYMLYLLNMTSVNGAYCGGNPQVNFVITTTTPEQFYGSGNTNCWNDLKNQINGIINAPPVPPSPSEETPPVEAPAPPKEPVETPNEGNSADDAQLTQQYRDYLNELQKYHDLWNQTNNQIQNNQPVDWDAVARALGMGPSIPDDINNRLGELNNYYNDLWNQLEGDRIATGMSYADYMRWLLGQSSNKDGQTCTDKNFCYDATRSQISGIINRSGIIPDTQTQPQADFFDLSTFLDRLHAQIPGFIRLLFALSYTIGILLFIISLLKFKHFGENASSRYVSSGPLTIPVAYAVAAIVLIYLPTALQVGTTTLLADNGDSSLFSYTLVKKGGFDYNAIVAQVVDIIKVVGLLTFIRGWIMLTKVGDQQHRGVTFRGVVHVCGGILAINIMGVYTIAAWVGGRIFH